MKVYRNLIYEEGYLLDPFVEEEVWIYRRNITDYFLENYGLNPQEVWNIVNGFDKDYTPKCLICGNDVEFSKLSRGFNKTCSKSCTTKLQLKNGLLEVVTEALNSVKSQAKGRFTQFLNSGDKDDPSVFYLAKTYEYPDYYKFGVTSNITYRTHFFSQNFSEYKILFEGTRLEVALLEKNLKISLNQNNEWIKEGDLNLFMNHFNLIKKSLNLI